MLSALVIILKLLPRMAAIIGAVSQVLKMIEREPKAPEAVCQEWLINLTPVGRRNGHFKRLSRHRWRN